MVYIFARKFLIYIKLEAKRWICFHFFWKNILYNLKRTYLELFCASSFFLFLLYFISKFVTQNECLYKIITLVPKQKATTKHRASNTYFTQHPAPSFPKFIHRFSFPIICSFPLALIRCKLWAKAFLLVISLLAVLLIINISVWLSK